MGRGRKELERWSSAKSKELYGVPNWSAGYFDVSEEGEVLVTPYGGGKGPAISLLDVVEGVQARGLAMPALLRFEDILDAQIRYMHDSFNRAIKQAGYQNVYRGVYPIKVNQQEQVVEEITRFGAEYHHGLEAGSKAELIAAISFMQDPEAYLICNGYKDEEFVDLALWAVTLGVRCVLVIESLAELPLILERAKALKVTPTLGVRIRLACSAGGHWSESGGDRSVFGLSASQVIEVVDTLREADCLDRLQMLHYHLGSQLPNIRDIRASVTEACRVYVGLVQEGAPMGLLDLGGGLAVDYDGSQTNFASSRNYTMDEYCSDVIEVIQQSMDEAELAHPVIITEAGRATVAYYSVLVFNILDVNRFASHPVPDELPEDTHELLHNLLEVPKQLTAKNIQECYNDALYYRDEMRQLFKVGGISLRQRALAEQVFWRIVRAISREAGRLKYVPEDVENLSERLADIYYGNFSVFQSLPDAWAIDQLFPIMPIHRLQEQPTREAILADITCDCDGKIDRFIDLHDVRRTLSLHEMKKGEEYYLGVFLVGAYQETLGDLHNLLGDTNVISIRVRPDGRIVYDREIEGDSVADVLTYAEYDPKGMVTRVRRMAEAAVREDRLKPQDRRRLMDAYESGLRGYTYYEK